MADVHVPLYPLSPDEVAVANAVPLTELERRQIAGAVAEVDPRQIAIYRQLTPAQRIWQLAALSAWLRQANLRRAQNRELLHDD